MTDKKAEPYPCFSNTRQTALQKVTFLAVKGHVLQSKRQPLTKHWKSSCCKSGTSMAAKRLAAYTQEGSDSYEPDPPFDCFLTFNYSKASNFSWSFAFVVAPTNLSTTCPFLKNSSVGIFLIPYCIGMSWHSSTLHLAMTARPRRLCRCL